MSGGRMSGGRMSGGRMSGGRMSGGTYGCQRAELWVKRPGPQRDQPPPGPTATPWSGLLG